MDTRERIIRAANEVMKEHGLAHVTTREIARHAGLSEGALYRHFASKEELVLDVLSRVPGNFLGLVTGLRRRAGSGSIVATLEEVAAAAVVYYGHTIPMGASIFSEPHLLERHQAALRARGAGPHMANEALATYLIEERRIGRLGTGADPVALAYLLLGACFQRAYWTLLIGDEPDDAELRRFVADVVGALTMGMAPAREG